MAHGRPWYKRNGGDFVMAVMHFPDNDHRWTYSAIVDTLNDRDRPIADDPAFICGLGRITKQKWTRVRAYLLEHGYLILTPDGRISNPRFERERAEREAEHERSVKAGREGGKKSAALRAGQGELDLPDNDLPKTTQETCKKHTNKLASFTSVDDEVSDGLPLKSNEKSEPPPQPSRAREEARGESLEEESSTATLRTPRERAVAVAADKVPDLLSRTARFCSLGGVALVNPRSHAREMDTVKSWSTSGYTDELIAEVIEEQFANTREDTVGSLNFYSQRLAKRHAERNGKPRPKPLPPAEPILAPPGEDPEFQPFRADLLKALGAQAFASYVNRVRFDKVSDFPGRTIVRITGQTTGLQLYDGHRVHLVKRVAAAHGFNEVWG